MGKDSYVFSGAPNNNYSTTNTLVVGGNGSAAYRAFIQIDLSSIPPNALLAPAQFDNYLELYQSSQSSTAGVWLLGERVFDDWKASSITWNNQPSGAFSGELTSSYCTTAGYKKFGWQNLLGPWVRGEIPNYGFVIRTTANPETTSNYKEFASSEHTTVEYRPKIVLNYTIPVSEAGGSPFGNINALGRRLIM